MVTSDDEKIIDYVRLRFMINEQEDNRIFLIILLENIFLLFLFFERIIWFVLRHNKNFNFFIKSVYILFKFKSVNNNR